MLLQALHLVPFFSEIFFWFPQDIIVGTWDLGHSKRILADPGSLENSALAIKLVTSFYWLDNKRRFAMSTFRPSCSEIITTHCHDRTWLIQRRLCIPEHVPECSRSYYFTGYAEFFNSNRETSKIPSLGVDEVTFATCGLLSFCWPSSVTTGWHTSVKNLFNSAFLSPGNKSCHSSWVTAKLV